MSEVYKLFIPTPNTQVKLLQSARFLFAMTNLNTSHYEVQKNTANLKSYYAFDIKPPVCLTWFYCKATLIEMTSILLPVLNHRNACKLSEWYPFVTVSFDNHLKKWCFLISYMLRARSINTPVWSLLYHINRICIMPDQIQLW